MRQHCENARAIAAFLYGPPGRRAGALPRPRRPSRPRGRAAADARLRRHGLLPRRDGGGGRRPRRENEAVLPRRVARRRREPDRAPRAHDPRLDRGRPVRRAAQPAPALRRDRGRRRPDRRPRGGPRRRRPRAPAPELVARAARPRVPRLLPRDRRLPGRDDRRPGALRLRARDDPAPASEGLRERGLELTDIRHLLLSHIHLDHAGAAGSIVREHPGADGLGLGGRGAAPRRPVAARGLRAPALRGSLRRPLGRARARACRERLGSRTGDVLGWEAFPVARATHRTTSATCGTATLLAGDAAASASSPPSTCCRSRRRRTSTSRPGTGRSPRSSDARPSCSRSSTSASRPTSRRTSTASARELDRWAGLVRDGLDAEAFVAAVRLPEAPEDALYDAIAPYGQSWQGLRRYWDKRGEGLRASEAGR